MSSSFLRHYDETKTLSYAISLISPTWSDGIHRVARITGKNFKAPGLLCGVIKTADDQKLYPTHCNKKGMRYHYYITKPADPDVSILRYSAAQIDDAIRNRLILWLTDVSEQDQSKSISDEKHRSSIVEQLQSTSIHDQKLAVYTLLKQVVICETNISMTVDTQLGTSDTPEWIKLDIEIVIEARKKDKKLVIPNSRQVIQKPDQKLIELIARAHIWAKDLQSGKFATVNALAEKYGINKVDLGKQLRLAYLAPDIVTAILEGRQPQSLKATHLRKLSKLPTCWEEQRKLLHFA